MALELPYPHIEKNSGDPARLGRIPRVRVSQIVLDYLAFGWSPDEMCRQHPYLMLAEAHAAMAYYFDNQAEIDAEIDEELTEWDLGVALAQNSPLRVRLCEGIALMSVSLYMDVHVPQAVTDQLLRRNVDVLTAIENDASEFGDDELLEHSARLGRLMVTFDVRFKALAESWQHSGRFFAGLIYAHPLRVTIGQLVHDLELIAKATDRTEWINIVDRLPL